MTASKQNSYRAALEALAASIRDTAASLEEGARTPTGGEASGNLSNAPMHLADMGSEAYTQELNATLLENEDNLAVEVNDALARLDRGTFGTCEECDTPIPAERLDAIPYARCCVPCAEMEETGGVNLNHGRPAGWGSTLDHPSAAAGRKRDGEGSPFTAPRGKADPDRHAAGTPGGGAASGGLGGTNANDGDPDDEAMEDALGSGESDTATDLPDADDGYAGPTGGAVGGFPANKRSVGGKAKDARTMRGSGGE